MQAYAPIHANSRSGDIVHQTQKMAVEEGFSNVSSRWFEKTISIEDGIERAAQEAARTVDREVSLGELMPDIRGGRFAILLQQRRSGASEHELYPNNYALRQLAKIASFPTPYASCLQSGRFEGDCELLSMAIEHELSKVSQDKRIRVRIRDNENLVGICPASLPWVPNEWYLKLLRSVVPESRLSHWRGDGDTIWGNLLVTDTIRADSDSEYGAMLSLSNSEVGQRRLQQIPSLFRAICMNGCIWGQTKGVAFAPTRKQLDDRPWLMQEIRRNIRKQIEISEDAVRRLLDARRFTTTVSMKPVMAQLKSDVRFTRLEATAVLDAWHVENQLTPDLSKSLFGVINSVTRAGQQLDNASWVRFDVLGGKLLADGEGYWQSLLERATRLSAKQVDNAYTVPC